jgi:hypothetical protein
MKTVTNRVKKCEACGYYSPSPPHVQGNCLRFARFVDHVINDYTRDCEYWSPRDEKSPKKRKTSSA